MDTQVINQLVQALEIIHAGPGVTSAQRKQAEELCEKARESPDAALYGHYLAHKAQNYPDAVRHFGLTLVENTVRYHWDNNNYTDAHRLQIRDAVVQLATEGLRGIDQEKLFIREKVAQVFTAVAERLWPQQWPDMDQLLRTMYTASPSTQEIALMTLRNLADDLGVFEDPLAMLRKTDLTNALICVLLSSETMQAAYPKGVKVQGSRSVALMQPENNNEGWLRRWVTTIREFHSELVRSDYILSPVSAILLKAHFEALKSTLNLAHLKGLLDIHWPTWLADYLQLARYPELQLLACDLWLVLSNRHFADVADRHEFFSQWMNPEILTRWSAIYAGYHQTDAKDDSETATVGLRFVEGTCDMVMNHLCHKSNRSQAPAHFQNLVELMLAMAESPNTLIASQAIGFWATAYKHRTVRQWLKESVPLPRILMSCINMAIRCGTILHLYTVDPEEELLPEFDSLNALRNYFLSTRLRSLDVIQVAITLSPGDTLPWLSEQLRQVFAKPIGSDFDVEQETGLFIANSLMETHLGTKLDTTAQNTVDSIKDSLCEKLIEFSPTNEALLLRQLQTLTAFNSVFQRQTRLLFSFLDKVFSMMLSAEPEYTENSANGLPRNLEAFQVQRKCATTLVKLALLIPDTFLSCYPQVSEAANRILNDERMPQSNKFHIYDFLLTICFRSSAPLDDKLMVASSIIDPFVEKWSALSAMCESQENFLELLGVYYLGRVKDNIDDKEYATIRERRSDLLLALSVFFILARRTISTRKHDTPDYPMVWQRYLPTVLPQLLLVIHQIHTLWDRKFLTGLGPDFSCLVDMSEFEKRAIVNNESFTQLGRKAEAKAGLHQARTRLQTALRAIRSWLDLTRETSYELLGYLVSLDQCYEIDPNLSHISKYVFGEATFISNYHWKFLINNVVVPAAMESPSRYYDTFLPHLLGPLVKFMHDKLSNEWQALMKRGLFLNTPEEQERFNTGAVDIEDITDEIVTENMLRGVTKVWGDFLIKVLTMDYVPRDSPSGGNGTTAPKTPHPVVEYILTNQALSTALVEEMCFYVCLKDSMCSFLAVNTTLKMIPKWTEYPHLYQPLAYDLLRATFQALNDPYHADNQDVLIGLVVLIYTTFRRLTDLPCKVLCQVPGVTPQDVETFEQKLSSTTSNKEMKAICKMFLQGIVGVDRSKWFQKKVAATAKGMPRSVFNVSQAVLDTTKSSSVVDEDPLFNLADLMP
ncbi:karyopherin [Dispira parvispora]|uniref:Karyopherin n=1 Tax=Dispira parvispora TaxID=1520584 RepID=A0A9W8AU84_9FUNG|nr:karyopherin [Dispira parvispora]